VEERRSVAGKSVASLEAVEMRDGWLDGIHPPESGLLKFQDQKPAAIDTKKSARRFVNVSDCKSEPLVVEERRSVAGKSVASLGAVDIRKSGEAEDIRAQIVPMSGFKRQKISRFGNRRLIFTDEQRLSEIQPMKKMEVIDVDKEVVEYLPDGKNELESAASKAVSAAVSRPTMGFSEGSVDWTGKNMERISRLHWEGKTRRTEFPFPHHLGLICSDGFLGIKGTKGLLDHKRCIRKQVPGLHDEASNALNSMRSKNGDKPMVKLCKDDFLFATVGDGEEQSFVPSTRITEGHEYARAGDCLLCDAIARCFLGKKVSHENTFWWGFPDHKAAREFLCLAILLTGGTSEFYTRLHVRSRKAYNKHLCELGEQRQVGRQPSRKKEAPKPEDGGVFLVAYCPTHKHPNREKLPFFYLIGKNSSPDVADSHNFCIAIPDVSCYKSLCVNGRLPKKTKDQALYIRPMHSRSCVVVMESTGRR